MLKGTLPAPTPKRPKCALTYSGAFAKHDNALLTICRHNCANTLPTQPLETLATPLFKKADTANTLMAVLSQERP
ncbi:hypothetical protein HK15_12650 [Acetobacter orientalis]|uniref:Uncharacterized protein n=1 Tax=Acetobacter orientalis TaxID=146474 RepID=A0A252BGK0_9PROT|nr:hypothetical protein HK15_12650 [Acetobacter orientalis]